MRLRKLSQRITLVFVAMLLVLQLVAFGVISTVIASNARDNLDDALEVGQRVFEKVLKSDSDKLRLAASVVAADFGFRAAVASGDQATVASALRNHGDRVKADVVMMVGLDGKLIADSRGPTPADQSFEFPHLIEAARREGSASIIGRVDDRSELLVAVPVKAPLTIGWVTMGFAIDDTLATTLQALISMDVSFARQQGDGRWQVFASSLPPALRADLGRQSLRSPTGARVHGERSTASTLTLGDAEYGSRTIELSGEDGELVVVLQRSLSEALTPFHRLQSALLTLMVLGVVVSVVGSVSTARGVTRPIATLIDFSRRIGAGDYSAQIDVEQRDEFGELASAFVAMRDGIAERETRITELAYQDRLTGLPNRVLFADRLQQAVATALRQGQQLAVMVMDLDRFKYVNDTLGHHIGDVLLREVARRLSEALPRASDTVARLGGDEFAVLLPFDGLEAAVLVAQRIQQSLEQPFDVEGQIVDVGVSIGIVVCPDNGSDPSALMSRADVAMYAAKRANSGHAIYDEKDDHNSAARLSLMSELRQAVEHDELKLVYQPKLDLVTGEVREVEALVRWDHPQRGFVSPDQFIPFAEQTGYIRYISCWVAEKAIRQAAAWRAAGIDLVVSINVSARDLLGGELAQTLQLMLRRHRLPPQQLCVEITESAVMDEPDRAIATLDGINKLGVRLSIDDFGTGYSSLAYLKRMPVDELKIDRSFVIAMLNDRDVAMIVRSVIDLGHNMGLKVVAEGVESAEGLAALREMNCDLAQGYFVNRPLTPQVLEGWLKERRAMAASSEPAAAADQLQASLEA